MDYIELSKQVDDEELIRTIQKDKDKKIQHAQEKKGDIVRVCGTTDKYYLTRYMNPKSLYKYAYMLLDTDNVDPVLSTDTMFVWNFLDYVNLITGTVCSTGIIRDVIAMRIYPIKTDLIIPNPEPGKIWSNNVVNLNFNFTVLIDEFKAQSYIGRDGSKFHFVLYPQLMNPITYDAWNKVFRMYPANPYIEFVTSGKGNGWFYFRTPMTQFSTLSVVFGSPFDPITKQTTVRTLIPLQFVYLREVDDFGQ